VRIIVSAENPDLPNWLDPSGHSFGSMCFRWNRADAHPQPRIREIDLADLEAFRVEEAAAPAKRLDYAPSRPEGRK
jgi:hypothetical protein